MLPTGPVKFKAGLPDKTSTVPMVRLVNFPYYFLHDLGSKFEIASCPAKQVKISVGFPRQVSDRHGDRVTAYFEHNLIKYSPIEGDLNGYLSGRSTRTFHTPPSYGAANT